MRANYQISLVFGFMALLLLWGICLHGPADGALEPDEKVVYVEECDG